MTTKQRVNGGAGPNPYDKRQRGQPPKLTPEMGEKAAKLIVEDGAMLAMLPGLLGVPARTFYHWTNRGRKEAARREKVEPKLKELDAEARAEHRRTKKREGLYYDFLQSVNGAIQERDRVLLGIIRRAANGAPKLVVKVKKELRTANVGSDEDPILDRTLIETERTETRTVEYDWRAAQYLLEKGQPKVFGPRVNVDINKALDVDPASFADMELSEMLELSKELQDALDGLGVDE